VVTLCFVCVVVDFRRLPWLVARASAKYAIVIMFSLQFADYCRYVCPLCQKWNKGKVREKLANAVMFDEKTYERLVAEVPKVFQ
jgi:hypothetical protein